jgi:Lon-like ATP-dependent protease
LKIAKINALNCLEGAERDNLLKKNIHVHFLSSSAPKDGPSAGTAICTALISLALNYRIPSNIAMTGEMSLNGNVCKIGGV